MKIRSVKIIFIGIVLFLFVSAGMSVDALAAEFNPVSVVEIDYEALTLKLETGNNPVCYISSDKKVWNEIDAYTDVNGNLVMDISWVSNSSSTTLYFKGNKNTDIEEIELPATNKKAKVILDKATGELDFVDYDEFEKFEWRKKTDYTWHAVSMDVTSNEYKKMLSKFENFRLKGIKIVVRGKAVKGTSASDVGVRPSKETTITIQKRANAPSISFNLSKMIIKTKETQEYYDSATDTWKDCDKDMELTKIASKAFLKNGGKDVTVKIRVAQTEKKPASKTAIVKIKAQSAAPSIGDSSKDVTYYYNNGKLVLQFNKATSENKYEYAILNSGEKLEDASFKEVKTNQAKTELLKNVPNGSKVYVRTKGKAGAVKKGETTYLPSEEGVFTISK